ncbi:hypothetical protein CUMW_173850 [Citrus unshiu]|uniref:Uncharacterized protein n=1 Tax=Citrus unshiu TaxID=55188 RepID=A0A2H5PX99_CITUN|nr:hypothetical protein CUMW_173850 [Citrus unshiu]
MVNNTPEQTSVSRSPVADLLSLIFMNVNWKFIFFMISTSIELTAVSTACFELVFPIFESG